MAVGTANIGKVEQPVGGDASSDYQHVTPGSVEGLNQAGCTTSLRCVAGATLNVVASADLQRAVRCKDTGEGQASPKIPLTKDLSCIQSDLPVRNPALGRSIQIDVESPER